MIVRDYMKKKVVSIDTTETIGQAAERFVARHVGMLPVVDKTGQLVGVLQLCDLLQLVLPDFTRLMDDFDFVGDFGAMESHPPTNDSLKQPVAEVMEPPFSIEETCGLSRAFAKLRRHDLTDIPVVDAQNHLVGIASRVDIGTALLKYWKSSSGVEKK